VAHSGAADRLWLQQIVDAAAQSIPQHAVGAESPSPDPTHGKTKRLGDCLHWLFVEIALHHDQSIAFWELLDRPTQQIRLLPVFELPLRGLRAATSV